jgi:predicted metal-dependent HD superfamily phosphohydrolase
MGQWEHWAAFWARIQARGDPREAFAALDAGYGAPDRVYHGWTHVLDCLERLSEARHLCVRPDAVEFALWFHDAVYDPRSSDNERRSASMGRDYAAAAGLGLPFGHSVEGLILATGHLDAPKADGAVADAPIMIDIDLSILGRDRSAFDAYDRAIRAEYSHLSEREYRAGRLRVLGSFQARRRIYGTDFFSARYEARARENLAAALARLGDQPR